MRERFIKVLHITPMYPSAERPAFGSFVKSQMDSLKKHADIELLVLPGLGGIFPYIKSIPEILRALKKRYDIIHIHYGNVSSMIKIIYRGKTPVVTSYCGDDLQGTQLKEGKYLFKSLFFKMLNVFFSGRDSYSIVKSELLAAKIRKRAKYIQIIPNGVDMNKFNPISREEALMKLGLTDDGKKIILFPADINRSSKNYEFLDRALSRFKNKYQFRVLSFKDGKVNPELVPYYFYAADLVAFPSLSEGSPNVVKEAMACSCIIFSSGCGDVPWLLKDVQGSKVLPLHLGEWIEALHEFFRGRISRNMSNSREMLFKKELDRESVAAKIISVYSTVLDKKYPG